MGEKGSYHSYIIQFSLVMAAVSAAYFFDPSNLWSLAVFLPIPLLFGHTAYISDEGFHYSTLLSLFALIFATVSHLALVALVIAFTNPLISLLSNGSDFKDYYRSVPIPMLFTGFLLGGLIVSASLYSPEIKNNVEDTASDLVGYGSEKFVQQAEIMENQEEVAETQIEATSRTAITLTQQQVLNSTEGLTQEQENQIITSFNDARREVPETMLEEAETQEEEPEVSDIAEESVESVINRETMVFLIPAIGFGFYALHPIVGLLTAIFGTSIAYLRRKV